MTNTTVVELYDPLQDQWTSAAPLPHINNGLTAAVWQGRIFAFGGLLSAMYVPEQDAWVSGAIMPTVRTNVAGGAVWEGETWSTTAPWEPAIRHTINRGYNRRILNAVASN